ncbi:MAG: response regulator [endosymbiont of Galathealinum brachiosum]|uniref:Response regulator n=1 Tax=endosymbiont of Galathealinum brachiosum TaxID=2200906 RepID=A0A370DK76_9GAMM|nr:MAG: response regulator [endosymbiont of Galathealinum brachiosum]
MPDDKTLMIVDDSKVSRMMIKAIVIDKQPEMNILEAGDGKEALELAEGKMIDFFSVDYNMPNMDGIEFITEMRNRRPEAKYALLTANIQDATHKKAEQIGAKCINKPISETCISTMLEHFNA